METAPIELYYNGKKLLIREFEINYAADFGQFSTIKVNAFFDDGDPKAVTVGNMTVAPQAGDSLKALLGDKTVKQENNMGRCYDGDEPCETKSCDSSGASLTKRVRIAKSSDNAKLLLKYRVIREDGTLSDRGKDLVLNTLFEDEDLRDKVIDSLQELDAMSITEIEE